MSAGVSVVLVMLALVRVSDDRADQRTGGYGTQVYGGGGRYGDGSFYGGRPAMGRSMPVGGIAELPDLNR